MSGSKQRKGTHLERVDGALGPPKAFTAMLIVCPLCDHSNQVVDVYKPGSILVCNCGVFLQFVGIGAQPRVVEEDEALFTDNSLTAKSSPKAG